jgi:hypothetical protein
MTKNTKRERDHSLLCIRIRDDVSVLRVPLTTAANSVFIHIFSCFGVPLHAIAIWK